VESAICVVLMLAGSLVLASFVALRSESVGFDPENVALVDLGMMQPVTADEQLAREARALARVRDLPDVSAVGTLGVWLFDAPIRPVSRFDAPPDARGPTVGDIPVGGAFFEVMGLTVVDGRLPTRRELDGRAPVAVVSERTARGFWPAGRAVGQSLTSDTDGVTVTVVGVVENVRLASQAPEEAFGEIYLPAGLGSSYKTLFLLKTTRDPDDVALQAAAALRADVPGVVVSRAESLNGAIAGTSRMERFRAVLLGVAGGAALLLLAVGVTGVVATSVSRRTREIGIRTALGARRDQVTRWMVGEQLRPAAVGVLAGLLASWWAVRLVSGFLYRVDPRDFRLWGATAVALLLVATVAAWIPARRAGRTAPSVALRME
jgi:hypothetical protein